MAEDEWGTVGIVDLYWFRSWSAINFSTMANAIYLHDLDYISNFVNDAIISNTYPPVIE